MFRRRCTHRNLRCIHGDEIWARMKVHTFRWWKPSVIRRAACLDCGRALDLDLPEICTRTGTPHTPPTTDAKEATEA